MFTFQISSFLFHLLPVLFLAIITGSCQVQQSQQAHQYDITVTAGAFDRSETVVSFYFPGEMPPGVSAAATAAPIKVRRHAAGMVPMLNSPQVEFQPHLTGGLRKVQYHAAWGIAP
jgi:hypothetical protein